MDACEQGKGPFLRLLTLTLLVLKTPGWRQPMDPAQV